MFKGIVAKQQARAEKSAILTDGVSFETLVNALDVAEDRFEERSRVTEIENARNLRNALEQFGGTPDGYRALMAFADADGSLSQAFGLNAGAALESLSDTAAVADSQKLAAGLEAYIVGEETLSLEGFREAIHRKKKKIALLWALGEFVANFTLFGRFAPGTAAASGAFVGGTLYVIDKIANSSRVEGTPDDVDELLNRTEIALNILKEASPEAFSKSADSEAAASGIASKIRGDLGKLGWMLVENKGGTLSVEQNKRSHVKDPARRMTPFRESGWSGDKLTAAVKRAHAIGERTKEVCTHVDTEIDRVLSEAGNPASADYLYDVVDVVSGEAERNLRMAASCLKSAKKFFTVKTDVKSEGDEGDKK